MSSSKKAKLAPRAKPATPKAKKTPADKVSMTRSLTTSMKASSHWAAATELQSTVASWNTIADALDANAKQLQTLRDQIAQIVLSQRTLMQTWSATTKHVFSSVDTLAGGDAETLQSFGFAPVVRGASAPVSVPDQITSLPGKLPGQAMVKWDPGLRVRHGYVVQHATDAANAATYSVPLVSTRRNYLLTGAQSAAVVQFRVAAVDPSSPTGQTAWSSWVAVTAR